MDLATAPAPLAVDNYATASRYASFHLSADGEVLLEIDAERSPTGRAPGGQAGGRSDS